MRLRVLDIETTGTDPAADHVLELGTIDLVDDWDGRRFENPSSRLYSTPVEIPAVARAVHHISRSDIPADAPPFGPSERREALQGEGRPTAYVAHQAAFERSFIGEAATAGTPWICTYKVALRLLPSAPAHSLQVLRYLLCPDLDPAQAMPPHRALPDAFVTAHVLSHLLQQAGVDEMVRWTGEPHLYPKIGFGRHRGSRWEEIDGDYLEWMAYAADMNPDAAWCALTELERRRQPEAA